MKASELITFLQSSIAENGDMPVCVAYEQSLHEVTGGDSVSVMRDANHAAIVFQVDYAYAPVFPPRRRDSDVDLDVTKPTATGQ